MAELNPTTVASRAARGGTLIFLGNFGSLIIGFFASIIIGRILGPERYGLYSLALLVPSALQLLVGFGLASSIRRYASYHLAKGNVRLAKRITDYSMLILVLSGVAVGVANYLAAGFFAITVLNRPELVPLIQQASFLVIGLTLFQGATAVLIGWNMMGFAGLTALVQDVFKLTLSVGFLFLGFGVLGAVAGQILSYVLSGVIALGRFYLLSPRQASKGVEETHGFTPVLRYGIPLYLSEMLTSFTSQYFLSFLVAIVASTVVVGEFAAANNFASVISLASYNSTMALFAAFSSLDGLRADARKPFLYAVRYTGFIISPMIFFAVSNSVPLLRLYGGSFASGSYILVLLCVALIPLSFGQALMGEYAAALGRSKLNLVYTLVGTVAIITLGLYLSVQLGVAGVLVALVLANVLQLVFGLVYLGGRLGAKVDFKSSLLGLGSSAAALAAALLLVPSGSVVFDLVARGAVFVPVYLTLAPLIGVINLEDTGRIRTAFAGSKGLNAIANPLMSYESMLIRRRDSLFGKRTSPDQSQGST
jgi:O-antigen/teichoic acid export membrane protein